jgi:anti-anti-sigma regulatory factor
LQSDCNIRTAREHHRALVDAFQTGDEIEIDAGRVERVDLTFIQLLASAMKTAKASQKRCRLVSVSEPLRGALARAGVRLSPSDDQIMWG